MASWCEANIPVDNASSSCFSTHVVTGDLRGLLGMFLSNHYHHYRSKLTIVIGLTTHFIAKWYLHSLHTQLGIVIVHSHIHNSLGTCSSSPPRQEAPPVSSFFALVPRRSSSSSFSVASKTSLVSPSAAPTVRLKFKALLRQVHLSQPATPSWREEGIQMLI